MIAAKRRATRPRIAIMRPTRLLGVIARDELAEVVGLDEEGECWVEDGKAERLEIDEWSLRMFVGMGEIVGE